MRDELVILSNELAEIIRAWALKKEPVHDRSMIDGAIFSGVMHIFRRMYQSGKDTSMYEAFINEAVLDLGKLLGTKLFLPDLMELKDGGVYVFTCTDKKDANAFERLLRSCEPITDKQIHFLLLPKLIHEVTASDRKLIEYLYKELPCE